MVDWKWFGWTLASCAFTASTALWVLRTFLHLGDYTAVRWAGAVFFAVLAALVLARIRFNAWRRAYLLTEDFAKAR